MIPNDGHNNPTPRPWSIRRSHTGRATAIVKKQTGKAADVIARLPRRKWDEGKTQEHEANARVIVASPDVLEAAKKVMEAVWNLERAIDRSEGGGK